MAAHGESKEIPELLLHSQSVHFFSLSFQQVNHLEITPDRSLLAAAGEALFKIYIVLSTVRAEIFDVV